MVHTASPRLVVGEPAASDAAVRGIEGVVAVSAGELPQSLLDRLAPEEQLFATAWASRMAETPKQRRGEGMAWDARGFVPPDET